MQSYIPSEEVFESSVLIFLEREYGYPFRLAFSALLMQCDSKGKFRWNLPSLADRILPLDAENPLEIEEVLDVFQAHQLVVKYTKEGNYYGYIKNFLNYVSTKTWTNDPNIPNPEQRLRINRTRKEELLKKTSKVIHRFIHRPLEQSTPCEDFSKLSTETNKPHFSKIQTLEFLRNLPHSLNLQILDLDLDLDLDLSIIYININILDLNTDLDLDLKLKEKEKEKLTTKDKEKEKEKSVTFSSTELFEQWWRTYPVKLEKAQCKEYFVKLKPTPEFTTKLIGAVEAQTREHALQASYTGFSPQWIYPIRWLKRKRWEDEVFTDENYWKEKKRKETPQPRSPAPQPKLYTPGTFQPSPRSLQTEQAVESVRKLLKGAGSPPDNSPKSKS